MKSAKWNEIVILILLLGGIIGETWNLTLFINNQSQTSNYESLINYDHYESDQLNDLSNNSFINTNQKTSKTSYIEHNPISINGNDDFNTTAYNEGWIGNGTKQNPFIIEGLNITATGSNGQISIQNTEVYFNITNCFIANGIYGINLFRVFNGQIDNNIIQNNSYYGYYHYNSGNITISDNYFANNYWGTYLGNFMFSPNTTIKNNVFNYDGIYLDAGNLAYYLTLNLQNNTVNGRPLVYLANKNSYSIPEDASQIILVNCTSLTIDNRTFENIPVGIEVFYGNNITVAQNIFSTVLPTYITDTVGIKILDNTIIRGGFTLYRSNHNLLSNNTFIKGGGGIELTDSNNNEIFSNNFLNLNSNGIYLSNSFNNNIYRNIFVKNNRGIELSTASSNFIIENIFINNTDYAIFSRYSYNTISGNDFLNNNPSGIAQSYSKRYSTPDYPKELINYNYWNDWTGPDVDSNGIVDFPYFLDTETNTLDSMDYYPLTDPNCFSYSIITYPTSNIILNGFINLEWTPANLYNYHARYNVSYSPDNGSTWYNLASNISTTTLSWDTTSVADGEHYLIKITAGWSIGFSYNIISDSEFSIKNIIPSIPASDIIVTSTIVNDTINWIATSSNASSYLLYQNNSIIESGSWISGKVFSYDISNLAPATYNFTLDIIDELGTHVSHSVILTIEPLSEPEITTITSTNTEVITSTPIETMTKTTTGFSLVVMALGLVGFLLIWKKRT